MLRHRYLRHDCFSYKELSLFFRRQSREKRYCRMERISGSCPGYRFSGLRAVTG
ncbi:hypothetical protein HMPREF1986_02217 [Oribacterium sp. oral taxon 078 str. F0263]|nr:hypothetical protein HMPREF1986_02217 [Oribacterium sp. oral taxon 078 str. F0263]